MGGLNVKNTMVERVLHIIAPHPCFGCGKVGGVLCDDCKYDITNEPFLGCILCGSPQRYGICIQHNSFIERAFIVGKRGGTLETLINKLKFERVKAAATPLSELLYERLPLLPQDTLIVPIPTVRSHVRQRGYDQVGLITARLAQLTNLETAHVLQRVTKTTQHIVGRRERARQAEGAFTLQNRMLKGQTVLLVDDIVTTGATLQSAARLLSEAGATVLVAALAYQPLD